MKLPNPSYTYSSAYRNDLLKELSRPLTEDELEEIEESIEFARIWTMIRAMRKRAGIYNPEPESDFWA